MLRAAIGRSPHRLSLPALSTVAARLFAAEAAPVEHESFDHILGSQLSSIKTAGTYKQEFEITSAQGPSICEHTPVTARPTVLVKTCGGSVHRQSCPVALQRSMDSKAEC